MRVVITQARLNKERGVVTNDGINAGRLRTHQNGAGEHKRNHVFFFKNRFALRFDLRGGCLQSFHLPKFLLGLRFGARVVVDTGTALCEMR